MTAHDDVAAALEYLRRIQLAGLDARMGAALALVAQALAEREDAETVARRLHDACPAQSLFIRPWGEMYERERGYWLTMARALETPHPQPKETQ